MIGRALDEQERAAAWKAHAWTFYELARARVEQLEARMAARERDASVELGPSASRAFDAK